MLVAASARPPLVRSVSLRTEATPRVPARTEPCWKTVPLNPVRSGCVRTARVWVPRRGFRSPSADQPEEDQEDVVKRKSFASHLPRWKTACGAACGESKHLLRILIPIINFPLDAMDLNSTATLEAISRSIVRSPVPLKLKNLFRGEPMALGITQILIGVLQISFGLVIVVAERDSDPYFNEEHLVTPYWAAITYIISGSLSAAVAKKPEKPLVKGMLGMNVVSAVAAGIGIVLFSLSVGIHRYYHSCYRYDYTIPPEICREYVTIPQVQIRYMSAVLLVFTILEFIIAISTAAFGCATLCRNNFSETTVVIFQNTAQGTAPAVLTPVKEDEVP